MDYWSSFYSNIIFMVTSNLLIWKYKTIHNNTKVSIKLPSQAGAVLINRLPETIKQINNVNIFQAQLK